MVCQDARCGTLELATRGRKGGRIMLSEPDGSVSVNNRIAGANVVDVAVKHGYCTGCGMCVALCPNDALTLHENSYGERVPTVTGDCGGKCSFCRSVCPMDANDDPDVLGAELFGEEVQTKRTSLLGWYHNTFVGGLADLEARLEYPSGGLATSMLIALLRRGRIDAAIGVRPLSERPWFRTEILDTEEQITASRGSAYHTVDYADVVKAVLRGPDRRYAVVALPCVVRALRLAQRRIPSLRNRISYVIGLACGSCHSLLFPDFLRGLLGNPVGEMCYRSKDTVKRTADLSLRIRHARQRHYLQSPFALSKFRGCGVLNACRFCDDITAELADVSFMDAWVPGYSGKRYGTNFVVSRTRELSNIMLDLFDSPDFEGGTVAPELIEESQHRTTLMSKRTRLPARIALNESGYVPRNRCGVDGDEAVQQELLEETRLQMQADQQTRELLKKRCPAIRESRGIAARLRAWMLFRELFYIWKAHYSFMKDSRLIDHIPRPRTLIWLKSTLKRCWKKR